MGDRNPPVTGYPAPNPHPNGYAGANPPPSGSAYPYVAAPPSNSYYNYYQNHPQYYQQDPDSIRRAICLRRIFTFVIGFLIIFGTVTFIVWLVLRPQLPEFGVDSLSVSNFTIGNNSLVSFNSKVGLTARNPNKKLTLNYDEMDAMLFYESGELSHTMVPPFYQDKRSQTSLTASFAAAGSFLEKDLVTGINGERGKNGNVNLNLRLASWVKFEARAWRGRSRFLRVFCGNLMVGLPINGTSGALIGGPKQCRVGV